MRTCRGTVTVFLLAAIIMVALMIGDSGRAYAISHLVDFDQAMKRSQMYKTAEGRAMLKLQEGDTHHGGCGHCGGDE